MHVRRRTGLVAATVLALGPGAIAPAPAAALSDCTIGNSAPVLTSFFSRVYIEAVRTQGYCLQTGAPVEEMNAPYTCIVYGIANGGLQAPAVLAGAGVRSPVENFCTATSDYALALEDCQEWYVQSTFAAFFGELGSAAGF